MRILIKVENYRKKKAVLQNQSTQLLCNSSFISLHVHKTMNFFFAYLFIYFSNIAMNDLFYRYYQSSSKFQILDNRQYTRSWLLQSKLRRAQLEITYSAAHGQSYSTYYMLLHSFLFSDNVFLHSFLFSYTTVLLYLYFILYTRVDSEKKLQAVAFEKQL